MQRFLLLIVVLVGCAACTPAAVPPAPTALPNPTALVLNSDAGLSAGAQVISGAALVTDAGVALYPTLVAAADTLSPLDRESSIWLGAITLPPLPEGAAPGANQLVQVAGVLEGPGSFGPAGSHRYQMLSSTLTPLTGRVIDFNLLLRNPALYQEQVVRLEGQLLLSASSALLSERSGPGGVPGDDALQLKLAPLPLDPALTDRLQPGSGGDVFYGVAIVSGIWRDNRLYPLLVSIP